MVPTVQPSMPPKKTAPARHRSVPLSETERPDDSEIDEDTPTPVTAADYRRLLARLNELEAREQERQAQSVQNPIRLKEPKIAPPPEFHGKVSEYRNFMAQCTLLFTLCPITYSTPQSKVLLTISRLRGRPLDWAREIPSNPEHPFHNDYTAFKTALDEIYLDRNYGALCEDKLNNLSPTSTVAAYAAEFQSLVEPLNWDENAKCSAFYQKLDDDMKDRIAIVGRAATFTQLMDQAIAIDQRRRQSRREKKSTIFSSVNKPPSAPSRSRDQDPLTSLHHLSKPQFKSSQSGSTIKFNSSKPTFPSSQNSSA